MKKGFINEAFRLQQLAGIIKEEVSEDQQVDQIADKVEDSLEAKLDKLTPEQIQQLQADLSKLGVTADSSAEEITQDLELDINEGDADSKQKLGNALDNIGTGLIGSLLVPLIPVAIGSTGIGVAAGFGITLAAAGLLKGLAHALKKKGGVNEEVTLDMDPSYGDNVYIKSTKEFGTWHDWGWGEDENGDPSTALVKIGRDKEPKEFPLSDIEVWKDEEEEEPERDADLWRDIKYDR